MTQFPADPAVLVWRPSRDRAACDDAGDTGNWHTASLQRLWQRGLSGARVSDALAEGGNGPIEKFAHAQFAYLRAEGVQTLRHDRQDRGRVVEIERLQRVVRGRDEDAQTAKDGKRNGADETNVSHAEPLPLSVFGSGL